MKLYKFMFSQYSASVRKEVLDVEEKPKTYMTTEAAWRTRINKSDIGVVDGFDNVYLLEDDEKKAKEIFCNKLKSSIEGKREQISIVERKISEMEKIIKEFSQED